MAKKLKRPIAFIATVAMVCSMLLYLPSGATTDHGFGLTVSAEDSTDADDTSTNDGTGDSTPTDTNGGGDSTPTDTNGGTGDSTPADTNGSGDSTPTDTNGGTGDTNATANPNANGANNEEDTTNDNAAVLLTASAETAHTHAPCGKESCGYGEHGSITYTPFSKAKFWGDLNFETPITFNGNTPPDLSGYTSVVLFDDNYYLDNDYTIDAPNGILFYSGNICLNGHKLTINTDSYDTPLSRQIILRYAIVPKVIAAVLIIKITF